MRTSVPGVDNRQSLIVRTSLQNATLSIQIRAFITKLQMPNTNANMNKTNRV
jgi:hypothetical protein